MMKIPAAAVTVLFLITQAWAAPAQARTVWRCGEGGSSYSDTPCPGGKAVVAVDRRDPQAVETARDQVQRDQALAERLRQQRLDDERRLLAANANAGNLGPTRPALQTTDKHRGKRKITRQSSLANTRATAADDDTYRATAPVSRRKRD